MIELVSLRVMLRELLVSMNFHVLHPFNTTQLNAFFALVITQMSITSLHVLFQGLLDVWVHILVCILKHNMQAFEEVENRLTLLTNNA